MSVGIHGVVAGDVLAYWRDAQHAGAFDAGQSALIVEGQGGAPVFCFASGAEAAMLSVLEPGDGVFITGKPAIVRDLDGRPFVALLIERWELLQARDEPAPWGLRWWLRVRGFGINRWLEQRLRKVRV